MESRYESSPKEVASMNTESLRANFLIEKLFEANQVNLTYTHYDRVITGGVMPVNAVVALPNYDALKSDYFLERRELGIINVGGDGKITADGEVFLINKLDCLYLGKGVKTASFESIDATNPAQYFLISSPAHHSYPTRLMKKEEASPVNLGSNQTSNERTIYKYIHLDGIRSCQLVMGLTVLANGSVWNTMPAHTHDRRMEVYCYFDIPQNQAVLHLMGQPQETRHLFVSNHQAIISPPWSVHSGCGTANYSFIWAMAGENQLFTDMDFVEIPSLR
ncbi:MULTISPECIES: 5-dehydro-4-deoxy-D-glucuronate isomerase [unclassified Arcicella]|uniref:5-dehydro-4-deoxy-D-glucuronate isomerase n=1 Tax=unclassified Arcicella TaxID=2644986 RepID=UPI002859A9AE|nr:MULTISPECIES: 5-dehydro-4-deoxy-D-glucuronate isomerase [unclassified Arcicella]MDR6562481.1 4-deoxy-L-threo-5-hexosulose-uronate ketol-isomerase [Arcicella sp. BE51]MDR6812568.1 4-deoxy-L-threo-5-hexosulose-uronate ketol-isomerase [Arcicella sp. BE140]MDR6823880.1 4-deoxy-L-threo-5-hexosulose-uronate ketol-isomerase [Arcicella sp. BE139]